MKVAIVHDFLFKMGGAERVVKAIADLYPEAPLYTLIYDERQCGEAFPKEKVVTSPLHDEPDFLLKRPRYLLGKMPQAIESFDFSAFDLVISSSGAFSHGIITPPHTKHLCYSHSPMRYAWDYTHEYLEEKALPFWKEFLIRKVLHKVRQWDSVASDRPDLYLANSQHVSKRLRKYYHLSAEVLYPPVNIDLFRSGMPSEDYFLIVSALSPFKKLDLAISAFNKMGKKLVIIGDGSQRKFLERIAGPTVEILGRKTDEEVKRYMESCRALVFPGEEDFGITPVEAMAAGKPVIAYGKGGVTESVVDGVTGVFFEEPTVRSLESAVAKFFENESRFNHKIIRARAEDFRPERFASQLKKTVENLMSSQK